MFFVADVGLQQDNTTNQFQNKMFEQMFEHLGQIQRAYEKLLIIQNVNEKENMIEERKRKMIKYVIHQLKELMNTIKFMKLNYNISI